MSHHRMNEMIVRSAEVRVEVWSRTDWRQWKEEIETYNYGPVGVVWRVQEEQKGRSALEQNGPVIDGFGLVCGRSVGEEKNN